MAKQTTKIAPARKHPSVADLERDITRLEEIITDCNERIRELIDENYDLRKKLARRTMTSEILGKRTNNYA
jgi:hypothetical protein